MSDDTYNGWTNYPTWNVSLWIGNDGSTQEYWVDRAQELANDFGKENATGRLADDLKSEIEDQSPIASDASTYADILGWALDQVDWHEIAENMLADVEVEEDDEEAEEDDDLDANGNENMHCNQCEATMIQGVYCHETGCSNTHKVKRNDEWVIEASEYDN